MSDLFQNPIFGIFLTISTFLIGFYFNKLSKKNPIVNPLIISIGLIIIILIIFNIPIESYRQGGNIINMFLAPITALLAVSVYRQRYVLRENFLPVFVGSLVGSIASIASVYGLCVAFGIDQKIMASMLPKSVTTAIAVEISAQLGGIASITVSAVICTGIIGGIFSPLFIKMFRVKNPIAAGVAIGTCSHAIGTSKAIEIGEVQGAMASVALSISGILTAVIMMLFY